MAFEPLHPNPNLRDMSPSKTILVTGSNKGIGQEIVRQLAKSGHTVWLTSRDESRGQASVQLLKSEGLEISFHQLDVSDERSIEKLKSDFERQDQKLDVLINNAGIYGRSSDTLIDMPIADLDEIMQTNFKGPLMMTRAMLPFLQKSEDPRIVNLSSGMGALNGMGSDHPAYRISKAALNAQTAVLARTLPLMKINTMCPGWVRTDMGGPNAPRSVDCGAETAVWLATAPDVPTGKFLRDKKEIEW